MLSINTVFGFLWYVDLLVTTTAISVIALHYYTILKGN
jgi:hypothetical protein